MHDKQKIRICNFYCQAREAAEQERTAALVSSSGSTEEAVALANKLQEVQHQLGELKTKQESKQAEWAAREADLQAASEAAIAEATTAKQAAEAIQEQLSVTTQDLEAARVELIATEVGYAV